MSRAEKFKKELDELLKRYRANISLEDTVSHGYGDAFPQHIVVDFDPVTMPDGEVVHESETLKLGEFVYYF